MSNPLTPNEENSTTAAAPEITTAKQGESVAQKLSTPKVVLGLGGVLLATAVICGATNTFAIKDFGKGQDITANKTYYLLADDEALSAANCVMSDGNNANIQDKISSVNLKINDNLEIQNVALPLAKSKGVYSDITFNSDIQGAKFVCEAGTNYISSMSGTTLQTLWWLTVIGGAAGIALLAMYFVLSRAQKPAQHNETAAATGESAESGDDPQKG